MMIYENIITPFNILVLYIVNNSSRERLLSSREMLFIKREQDAKSYSKGCDIAFDHSLQ